MKRPVTQLELLIEAYMGGKEECTFNINQAKYNLEGSDFISTEKEVNNYITILEEYKKML